MAITKNNDLHVFWIHSHITWIISKLIIESKNLNQDDILILTYRRYKNNDPLFKKLKSFELNEVYFNSGFKKVLNTQKRIKTFNSTTKSILKNRFFQLYIPQTRIDAISILIENKLCIAFYYIEEGLSSYVSNNFENQSNLCNNVILSVFGLSKLKNSFKQNYFLPNHSKLINCYTLSPDCFPTVKNKIVLSYSSSPINQTIEAILIFDALVSFNLLNLDDFIHLLRDRVIPIIRKNGYTNVHYKFHPEQFNNQKEIEKVRTILKNENQNYIELEPQFILEDAVFSQQNLDVFCFVSSIGIYGTIGSKKVYSLFKHLQSTKVIDNTINIPFIKKWISL